MWVKVTYCPATDTKGARLHVTPMVAGMKGRYVSRDYRLKYAEQADQEARNYANEALGREGYPLDTFASEQIFVRETGPEARRLQREYKFG